MTQNKGTVSHPEVRVRIPFEVHEFAPLRFFSVERVWSEISKGPRDSSGDNLDSPFIKFLRDNLRQIDQAQS